MSVTIKIISYLDKNTVLTRSKIKQVMTNSNNQDLIHHIHCSRYIFSSNHRFLFYEFYFGFYSLNSSNIHYSTKRPSIHYDLFLQQRFYSHPLLFYAHYYHLPKSNTSFAIIQQILQ